MPGIFISHSSKDKDFVYKLACHLSVDGYPVWLDTWSMTPGDSLVDKIYEAVDESSIVIVVLSINSIESDWVRKELTAALLKEEEIGRKFIVPIVIDEILAPLKVRDRLQARFSNGFYKGMGALNNALNDTKIKEVSIPFKERVIPIEFSRGIHLKKANLVKYLKFLKKTNSGNETVSENNIVIPEEALYTKLKEHLFELLENLEHEEAYSQYVENHLHALRIRMERFDNYIRRGLALLINRSLMLEHAPEFIVESCYWLAKRIRADIICNLKLLVEEDQLLEYAPDVPKSPMQLENQSDPEYRNFYEIESLVKVVVFNRNSDEHVVVFCDGRAGLPRVLKGRFGVQFKLTDFLHDFDFIYKYLFPQMIFLYVIGEELERPEPLFWNFNELYVALN